MTLQTELLGFYEAYGIQKNVYEPFLKNLVSKYWNRFDSDESEDLNFDELRYMQYAIANTDANLMLNWFDYDENGALNVTEVDELWQYQLEYQFKEMGGEIEDCLVDAWDDSDCKFLSLSIILI